MQPPNKLRDHSNWRLAINQGRSKVPDGLEIGLGSLTVIEKSTIV